MARMTSSSSPLARRAVAAAALVATALVATISSSQTPPADPHAAPARPMAAPVAADPHAAPNRPVAPPPGVGDPHGAHPGQLGAPPGAPGANPHGAPIRIAAPPGGAHGAPTTGHGAADHGGGHEEHGGHAEHDEKAPPPPINWWHGLLGEKAGEPPSIMWREPGEPPPFLASLLNFALLVIIVVKYGGPALSASLVKRKATITGEIDEATRLRKSAEKRLAEYESKLEKISDELERVRREFREQGERDKARIIQEAKERRERMVKDTELVLSQEMKQLRQELTSEVVKEATRLAAEILSRSTTLGDHDRFAEAFLNQLRAGTRVGGGSSGGRGGSAYPGPAAAKGNPS